MAVKHDNLLENAKLDLVARLESDPFFADVHVLYEDEGDLDVDRHNALAGIKSKSGRKGAAVIIHAVDVIRVEGQGPVPQMAFGAAIECAETRQINHSNKGTGKTASMIAARVVQVLNHYTPHHLCLGSWFLPDNPIQELSLLKGMVGFSVELNNYGSFKKVPKVATPTAAGAGLVTLSCITEGAEIFYTLDGRYPSETNGAIRYINPVQVGDDDALAFVATKDDHNASDVQTFES